MEKKTLKGRVIKVVNSEMQGMVMVVKRRDPNIIQQKVVQTHILGIKVARSIHLVKLGKQDTKEGDKILFYSFGIHIFNES
ncbi:hypothetical protein TNCT_262011 [Trichonephila clavata]|uniref:Uncharacterized protein n=1 Tax=Trichonephila clavata TaxID=2740835 RepID=A0A8X6GS78_TRICU|nr:hypothetical protein TNCT_262011 [Trichonephila clavata]